MKRTWAYMASLALAATITLIGCRQSDPAEEAVSPVPPEHMATGILNAIDTTAGTVNIAHGAVPSAGWPEMTMNFKLEDPKAAAQLTPGQRVDFHFRIDSGMDATVTFIAPID